jgi:hypothetical protein
MEKGRGWCRSSSCNVMLFYRLLRLSLTRLSSTGLPLSTYFSAIKLRWMIDHYPDVHKAHESDDLLFGTIESWLVYVRAKVSVICLSLEQRTCYRISLAVSRKVFTLARSPTPPVRSSSTPLLSNGSHLLSNFSASACPSFRNWYQRPKSTVISTLDHSLVYLSVDLSAISKEHLLVTSV